MIKSTRQTDVFYSGDGVFLVAGYTVIGHVDCKKGTHDVLELVFIELFRCLVDEECAPIINISP